MKYLSVFLFIIFSFSVQQAAARTPSDTLQPFQAINRLLIANPAFSFGRTPVSLVVEERQHSGNEGLFYFILGMVLFLALVRLFFFKYVTTLFTLFFRATMRQQQLREQLLQAPLPALLLNMFFVISLGAYLAFLAGYYKLPMAEHFRTTLLYATALVALIYTAKYIILKIVGWIFGISSMSGTYIFIVFLINKMIGIFLLPVLILLAFPEPTLVPMVILVSYFLLGGILLYRFVISYRPVRAEIKLSRLHFFFYLCAFELAPLLLIYKVLLTFMDSRY